MWGVGVCICVPLYAFKFKLTWFMAVELEGYAWCDSCTHCMCHVR
jgi:hypothetical protein